MLGGQRHAPATLPQKRDLVPIVQETGWALGPVCKNTENLAPPPPEFQPRTVQLVASRYTNYVQPVASRYSNYASPTAINLAVLILTARY